MRLLLDVTGLKNIDIPYSVSIMALMFLIVPMEVRASMR